MIVRLFVHNFRCLVNFELRLDRINLLMGPNGAGKSTVFDALYKLSRFIADGEAVDTVFEANDFPRWNRDQEIWQKFEVEIQGNSGRYIYALELEYRLDRKLARIGSEYLRFNDKPLYEFHADQEGRARLYRDDHSLGGEYLFDWSRSGVGVLQERNENTRLVWFRRKLSAILVIRPNPALMGAESRQEARYPQPNLVNFASWYRYLSQDRQGQIMDLSADLRKVIPGFDYLRLQEAGDAKVLMVRFKVSGGVQEYRLDELSDGQRILIALYTVLHCAPEEHGIICIDEPENFLALPEIQLWLDELDARCQEGKLQALLISHHPRPINYLARDAGLWIERIGIGEPSRVLPIRSEGEMTGLPVSQLVERGWIYDD